MQATRKDGIGLFDLEEQTQCKDMATVIRFINTLIKMTVNSCSVTTSGRIKSNLLKCN